MHSLCNGQDDGDDDDDKLYENENDGDDTPECTAFAMVKMVIRKGRKRMKMTTKAMVKMSAHPLQCFDISETKNDPDNSMNEETIT